MENKIYNHPYYGEIYYLIEIPDALKNKQNVPLLIFLHGAGERGHDHELIKVNGIPKYIEQQKLSLPVISVCPQCPQPLTWADSISMLKDFTEHIISEYSVDRSRMAITGLSMGGYGSWEMIMTYPDYFKKAAPICGGGTPWRVGNIKADVWTFHGDKDTVVTIENSLMLVDAMKNAGKKVKFTIFHNVDHGSWDAAYLDTKVIDWLCDL